MKNINYLVLLLIIFFSCQRIILGEDENNNPENIFELLWHDLDNHYALFRVKQVNWDSLYTVYRALVNSETSEEELWQILTALLEHLNDGHTTLIDIESEQIFASGDSLNQLALEEFDLTLIKMKYLDFHRITSEEEISYGKIKDKDIGYIHLFGVEGSMPEIIDSLIDALKHHAAIIVDVRNNSGGSDFYAHRVSGAFADEAYFIYTVQTRNGKEYDDFDEKRYRYTTPSGDEQFLKPVILLTDRFTISGGEIFVLNMVAFPHVTHIGDTTAGDFSYQSYARFLPNGWVYTYSSQLYLIPSGESLEGIGVAPNVYSKNTKTDIQANNDLVIQKAVEYLFSEYGIE